MGATVTGPRPVTLTLASGRPAHTVLTRRDAAADRELLNKLLAASAPISVLTLDFTGIDAMTLLYAESFLGAFYTGLAAGDVPAQGVRLVGLNGETRHTAHACLESRRDTALDGDRDELLGYVAALTDTYRAARELGRFRACDLADAMGIKASAANNRLTRLVRAGALIRGSSRPEHGGREYEYRTLAAEAGR